GVQALGTADGSAPVLLGGCPGQRRTSSHGALLDHRGWRNDRHVLGSRVVRGVPGSQLGLQPGVQNGSALNHGYGHFLFLFVLGLFMVPRCPYHGTVEQSPCPFCSYSAYVSW